jgi:hypothetical protein
MRFLWGTNWTFIYYIEGINISVHRENQGDRGFVEIQFKSHDFCDESNERRVDIRVQALLASVESTPLGKVRPCDIHELVNSLKLRKACGLEGIPNECLKHFPRRSFVYLTHLFNRCLRLSNFPKPWKQAKSVTLPKPGKDPKIPSKRMSD